MLHAGHLNGSLQVRSPWYNHTGWLGIKQQSASLPCRFEIEKKLKKAKREQRKSKPASQPQSQVQSQAVTDGASVPTVSERSKERRKNIEDRKDSKKTSAFQDLKARREEKLKKGKWKCPCVIVCFFFVFVFLGGGGVIFYNGASSLKIWTGLFS